MGAETASHSLRVEANSAAERSRVVVTLGVVACFPSSPPLRTLRGVAPMDIDKKVDVADADSRLASGNSSTRSIFDAPQPILDLNYLLRYFVCPLSLNNSRFQKIENSLLQKYSLRTTVCEIAPKNPKLIILEHILPSENSLTCQV